MKISSMSCTRFGNFLSVTVRKNKDDDAATATAVGIKLRRCPKGSVTIKNVASNGLFGSSGVEVGDTVISLNGRKLREAESVDEMMRWIDESQTITLSVMKKRQTSKPENVAAEVTEGEEEEEKPSKKSKKRSTTTVASNVPAAVSERWGMEEAGANNNNVVTLTAEKYTTDVGLILEIRNKDQLFVKDILKPSIFFAAESDEEEGDGGKASSNQQKLEAGDRILSINDMNFRRYADVDYAYLILSKTKVMVTLVVEKMKQQSTKSNSQKKTKKKKASTKTKKQQTCCNTKKPQQESFPAQKLPKLGGIPSTVTLFDGEASMISMLNASFDFSLAATSISSGCNSFNGSKKRKSTSRQPRSRHHGVTNSSRYDFIVESDDKIERYKPCTITVRKPKGYSYTDVGVDFSTTKTSRSDVLNDVEEHDAIVFNSGKSTSWITVSKIANDSLFRNTPLQVGDKVISINDTNLRGGNKECCSSPSMGRAAFVNKADAFRACAKAKEIITMIVLKKDEEYFEKSFTFDHSCSSDLEWVQ